MSTQKVNCDIEERYTKNNEKRYRARIRVTLPSGKRKSVSQTFSRKTDAQLWLQIESAKFTNQATLPDMENNHRLVNDMLDKYIREELPKRNTDHQKFNSILIWWKEQIGHYRLNDVTPKLISEKRDLLATEPAYYRSPKGELRTRTVRGKKRNQKAPATVKHYLATLSIAYSAAIKDWFWNITNPVLDVRKPFVDNERDRFLSDHLFVVPGDMQPTDWYAITPDKRNAIVQMYPDAFELPRYLQACKALVPRYSYDSMALYDFSIVLLGTSLRYTNARLLTRTDFNPVTNILIVRETKNKKPTATRVTGEVLRVLKRRYANVRTDSPYLFPSLKGTVPFDFENRFQAAVKEASIVDFCMHDFRHTSSSYAAMLGATERELMGLLNHKSASMAKRYSHLNTEHLASIRSKTNEHLFPDTSERANDNDAPEEEMEEAV